MKAFRNIHQSLVQAVFRSFGNQPTEVRKVLLLTYMSIIVILNTVVFGIYYMITALPTAAFICNYGGTSAVGLLIWMYANRSTKYGAHFFCASTIIFFLLFCIFTGGIESPFSVWFVTAPLVGSLLLKNWEAWLWSGIALVLLPTIYFLTPILPDPNDWGFEGRERAITIIGQGGFLLFCIGIIASLELARSDLARLNRVKSAERAEAAAATKAVVMARDQERQRIARELHDHIGAVITVVRLKHESSLGTHAIQENGQDFFKQLESLGNRLSKASRWFSLHVLRDFGLLEALIFLKEESERDLDKSIELILPSKSSPSLEHYGTQIYRIIQEVLDYPSSYDKTEHIALQLLEMDDQIRLMAEVWGEGLAEKLEQSQTWASKLVEIQDRSRVIGGDIFYETSAESGLTLIIEIPLIYGTDKIDVG